MIGAPEEIRTPDPQIRSLGSDTEIIEVRYRKRAHLGHSPLFSARGVAAPFPEVITSASVLISDPDNRRSEVAKGPISYIQTALIV
jgi:hypothetical protein